MIAPIWQPMLPPELRSHTLEIVSQVAQRLCDSERTQAIAEAVKQQSAAPFPIDPPSLTFGPQGPALACAYLNHCFPDQGWDSIAHRYLDTSRVPQVLSYPYLYGGMSGLGFIMTLLSDDGTRYQKTLTQLNKRLCAQLTQQPGPQAGLSGVGEYEYDLIDGASGILAYLIHLHSPREEIQAAIERLLIYLVWLADIDLEHQRERWYVPPGRAVAEEKRQLQPDGCYNCGLAHGIPGPLAVLAVAWLEGYRVPGQREAMRFVSNWLLRYTLSDAWGINWPDMVSLPASQSTEIWKQSQPARSAWCYGAPGIARALWLAGLALEEPVLCHTAVDALEVVLQRPIASRRINSPTLCHGIAGLLLICLRFAHETESTIIREHIPRLANQILELFNSDFPLGFRDQERDQIFVDQPTWLNGAPGIILALLAASMPVEPAWDRIMLLS